MKVKYILVTKFLCLFILIVFIFTSCANNNNTTPQNTPTPANDTEEPGNQAENADATISPNPTQTLEEAGFTSGMYKVGQDMPSGEYKLFSTEGLSGVSYFEIAKDSTGGLDSIIANDNFFSFTYVTVADGQYFKFTDARAVPAVEAAKSEPVDGKYVSGMYKVGIDIPPGEYQVFPEEDSTLGYGYYEITKSSLHVLEDIVSNDNFEDPRYITLQGGQYLKLNEAYIEP
jgi:hypothetical protein